MKTDRELLELAAKAAGYEADFTKPYEIKVDRDWHKWNPLEDDGDNRRLQVKLFLALIPCESGGWDAVRYDSESYEEIMVVSDVDPKRAIVRAAAAIGESL